MDRARLITLDWGTSNLRARLLGDGGAVWQTRVSAGGGILAVPERRFADALSALCGDWIDEHRCPLVASGMIGSRQGWQEAPYLDCPATLADAATRLLPVAVGAGTDAMLHIVPGLRCVGADGQYDVMRGEETQLWGAALAAGRCCVLPGTHSKWAWVGARSAIERFQTHMTGEFYALLTQHGILGKLMQFGMPSAAAFAQGAQLGLQGHGTLMHTVFAARTAGLMERLPPAELPDFLSGILIGAEIGGALLSGAPAGPVALLGEAVLCERYAAAFAVAGLPTSRVDDDATTRGQWQLGLQAGLTGDSR
jgi:2-dehydro-3-deoxygalactonokinase